MRKYGTLLLMVALPVAGFFVGGMVGAFLSRTDYTVRVASAVKHEDASRARRGEVLVSSPTRQDEQTLLAQAFDQTGESRESLFARARDVQDFFRRAGAIFGVWCGLVFAGRFFIVTRRRRRDVWDINQYRCVACTRCYLSCPREHARLRSRT